MKYRKIVKNGEIETVSDDSESNGYTVIGNGHANMGIGELQSAPTERTRLLPTSDTEDQSGGLGSKMQRIMLVSK